MLPKISLIWRLSICTGILFCCLRPSLHASEDTPLITDNEEYTVMAAVLFHGAPRPAANSTEQRTNPDFRDGTSLAGIPADFFNLSRQTTTGSLSDEGLDRTIIDDFNHKNAMAHLIDPDKFSALAPKASRVTLVTPKRFSLDEKPREHRSGITYISRPGFNMAKTVAILNVSHVADFEMGIGYRVTLEKSTQDGTWSIADAVINRRY